MDILKEYKKYQENLDTLYSIIIYDKKISEIIKTIDGHLEKAKNITNPIKKNKIHNRLYLFKTFLEDKYEEEIMINCIYFIHDKIIEYSLKENEIWIAKEYQFHSFFIKNDTFFLIDYFIDLFYNLDFIYTIKINKNEMIIGKINKNKGKEIQTMKINLDEIENIRKIYNYKDSIIMYGNLQSYINKLEKIKGLIIYNELNGNREVLYQLYENEKMKKNMNELEKKLVDIHNPNTNLDLYVFGKLKVEIREAIESYSLKELYIEDKKLEKLKSFIDHDLLNFKIYPIQSLESNDIAERFIKDYHGIMGIKYY
jgi:hypothetical protein